MNTVHGEVHDALGDVLLHTFVVLAETDDVACEVRDHVHKRL